MGSGVTSIGIAEHSAVNNTLSVFVTFILASFAWIFFVSANLHDALYVSTHLFTGWGQALSVHGMKSVVTALGGNDTIIGAFNALAGMVLILFLEYVQSRTKDGPAINIVRNKPTFIR